MKKFDINEGKDSINRALLLMKYDNKKTLSENIEEQSSPNVIQPQSSGTKFSESQLNDWFKKVAIQFMKTPETITQNFGNTTGDITKRVKAFNDAISKKGRFGIPLPGRDQSGVDYVISSSFKSLPDTIEFLKKYPDVNGESFYKALEGEWFTGGLTDRMVTLVAKQLRGWCTTNPKVSFCTPKTEEQLKQAQLKQKYGSL